MPYSLYSSQSGKFDGPDVQVLKAETNIDKFIGSLPDKGVILKSKPNPNAEFDSTDSWKSWMTNLDPNVEASLTWDGAQSIQSFQLKFTPSFSKQALSFSSSPECLNNTFGPPSQMGQGSTAKIPEPGIGNDGNLLFYGLDTTNMAVVNTNVADLFKFIGAEVSIANLPPTLAAAHVSLNPAKTYQQRNAIWVRPSFALQTTVRFSFSLDSYDDIVSPLKGALPGLNLLDVSVVCEKVLTMGKTAKGTVAVESGTVTFYAAGLVTVKSEGSAQISASVTFSRRQVSITLLMNEANTLDTILSWLADLIQDKDIKDIVKQLLGQDKIFPIVNLRRVQLMLDGADPKNLKLSSFSTDIEVQADFGGETTDTKVTFLVGYSWRQGLGALGQLTGTFWPGGAAFDDTSPYYEPWTTLVPLNKNTAKYINLPTIVPGQKVSNIPDTIPSQITRASISVDKTTFALTAFIDAKKPTASSVPIPYLSEISINASYSWGRASAFTLSVQIMAGLLPSISSKHQTQASLVGSINYNAGKWELMAVIDGLYASTLYQFFDPEAEDQIVPLLDSIGIDTLTVKYTYANGVGNSCQIDGILFIGALKLELKFSYAETLSFTATLRSGSNATTLGSIISSFTGDESLNLPDFAANMEIGRDDHLTIQIFRGASRAFLSESGQPFVFLADFRLKALEFAFLQYRDSAWKSTTPGKRLFKVRLTALPTIEIPIIGKITQPFDEMYYLWVQDNSKTNKGDMGGLTRAEKAIVDSYIPLYAKDTLKETAPSDVLILAGSHFAVIVKGNNGQPVCLLDYDFTSQEKKVTRHVEDLPTANTIAHVSGASAAGAGGNGNSAQAPLKKVQGPITISNLGLKYADGTLYVLLDASLVLGPLGFVLDGFSLNFTITTLNDPESWKIGAAIEGLSVMFDKTPLTIAGIIRHGNDGNLDYYAGGLVVGFVPYQFMAAGFYGTTKDSKDTPFTSVFVFAKLNGPLVTLEFATISGITGGIGYNSSVRFPTAAEVTQYPFVAPDALGGGDTVTALDALTQLVSPKEGHGWFSPLKDSYWAAAGMKVDAFQMLSIDAVVVVQFGDSVKLGIFAVATADLPTTASKKFAHIELGIAVTVDFGYGVLRTEGQLSPNSYILAPDCHLTGGFGFCYWFDAPQADSNNIGQFVFTVGGYHPAFERPVAYPNPPRLGISWNLGRNLSITGEAYFAITPKVCMGGGRYHAAFSAGPIEAWFDAFANFLINYKPFHFIASAGIAVGVRFNFDFLCIHKHISAEISASLTLWGPPVAGRVHVNFWVHAFDINFGDGNSDPEKVKLADFYDLVRQSNQETAKGNDSHVFTALNGLMNDDSHAEKEPGAPWVVRGGTFRFAITCIMAIDTARFKDGDQLTYTDNKIFSKPMHIQKPLDSKLEIKIFEDSKEQDIQWRRERIIKSVPKGLWAQYNAEDDSSNGNNNVKSLLTGDETSVPLMMGVALTAPPAILSPDKLPRFNIEDASLSNIHAEKPFPPETHAADAFRPVPPKSGPQPYPDKPQFDAVADAWTNPDWLTKSPPIAAASFVQKWATAMRWPDSDKLAKAAGIPRKLKSQFSNLYVASPLLSV